MVGQTILTYIGVRLKESMWECPAALEVVEGMKTNSRDAVQREAAGHYLNRTADPSSLVWLTNLSKLRSMTSLKISSASSGANQKTE